MNNKKSKNNNNSGLPTLIIGGVLLVAVIGGWWLYSSSKTIPNKPPGNRPLPSPSVQPTQMINTKDLGAQPPHFKGSQNAPVVIEEFVDFQCGTCAAMHPVFNDISATYGSRVKIIYRNFPLTQIHPNAYDASVAAEAAGLQGKFWEMQNLLFQNQQRWSAAPNARALFESYAGTIGLDVEKFKTDILGLSAKGRVDADLQRGRSLNITSTPTIIINNKPVPVEMMTGVGFKEIIEGELAKAARGGQTQTSPASTVQPAGNKAAENSNAKPENK